MDVDSTEWAFEVDASGEEIKNLPLSKPRLKRSIAQLSEEDDEESCTVPVDMCYCRDCAPLQAIVVRRWPCLGCQREFDRECVILENDG